MPHGGARPNSGRKSKQELLLDAKNHAKAVAGFFSLEVQESTWREILSSDDENVKLKALIYLTDKMYGKAHQALQITGSEGGPIQSAITVTFVKNTPNE